MAALRPVESDAIAAVGYDANRSVLTVRYSNGRTYEYFGVPKSLYTSLIAAQPHPWTRFGNRVKSFRFRRIS